MKSWTTNRRSRKLVPGAQSFRSGLFAFLVSCAIAAGGCGKPVVRSENGAGPVNVQVAYHTGMPHPGTSEPAVFDLTAPFCRWFMGSVSNGYADHFLPVPPENQAFLSGREPVVARRPRLRRGIHRSGVGTTRRGIPGAAAIVRAANRCLHRLDPRRRLCRRPAPAHPLLVCERGMQAGFPQRRTRTDRMRAGLRHLLLQSHQLCEPLSRRSARDGARVRARSRLPPVHQAEIDAYYNDLADPSDLHPRARPLLRLPPRTRVGLGLHRSFGQGTDGPGDGIGGCQ